TSVPRATGERVQEINIAYAPHDQPPAVGSAPVLKLSAPRKPREAVVPVPRLPDVPALPPLPSIDTESMVDAPLLLSVGKDELNIAPLLAPMPQSRSSDGSVASTYVDGSMDTSAVQFPENPKPGYPSDMLRQMQEAHFVVYFVVDSSGRVDMSTVEVPPSVRPSFARSVKLALSQWHYYPAQKRGRRVRQFMGQEFIFRVERSRYWDGSATA
ncbi:MAG: hypothetical protein DMD35_10630, partial [Gemmatimonadetes bacterium]